MIELSSNDSPSPPNVEAMTPRHDEPESQGAATPAKVSTTHRPPLRRPKRPEKVLKSKSSSSDSVASVKGSTENVNEQSGGPPPAVTSRPPGAAPSNIEEEESEWSKLRCGSLTTEELVQREKDKEARRNRQNRCADYPGFAFGSAMFGSDTTMKFNIIKNELHNIMRSQLKRVDGEVNALSTRIKEFDKKLEESEKLIRVATTALADAVALQIEESKSQDDDDEKESSLSAFDQHVLFLEGQLREARLNATLNFQILEDCDQIQENILLGKTSSATVSPQHQPHSDPEPVLEEMETSPPASLPTHQLSSVNNAHSNHSFNSSRDCGDNNNNVGVHNNSGDDDNDNNNNVNNNDYCNGNQSASECGQDNYPPGRSIAAGRRSESGDDDPCKKPAAGHRNSQGVSEDELNANVASEVK